jgi:Chlorophyllase enzyme
MASKLTWQFSTAARSAVRYGVAGLVMACSSTKMDGGTPETSGPPASSSVQASSNASSTAANSVSPSVTSNGTSGSSSAAPTSNTSETTPNTESPSPSSTGVASSDSSETDGTASQSSAPTDTPAPGSGCTVGGWPAIDPAEPGPFETVTETEVGPLAGEGEDGEPVAFTVFRPADLTESGRCHPIVTWGNGTGSNPSLYRVLLNHLASHGFIVVASDSPNVAQGDPPPMVAGVTWLIEENEKSDSPYFHHVDVEHVGATGHSQGGFATTQAGGDSHIKTIAPLCGASGQRNLHGPALLLCGGADDVVDCEGIANALNSIQQPAMLANYITADHGNWVTFRGTTLSPMEVATVAWMRVHLMNDTALRPWFYGADCKLCTDEAWEITQKMMDE